VIALGMTSFFMSIMFPTIFALGVGGLGERTKLGSSLLIMSIIGGALFPPLVGLIADRSHSIQLAMGVPLVSFLVVAWFGRYMARAGTLAGLHL
jgi:MFS transporter, FHS family, L-fucose permease